MKKIFPIIFVLLLVSSAGCLGGSDEISAPKAIGIGQTKGVELTEFSSIAIIDSGEILDVSVYAQNMGDAYADGLDIKLYQLNGFTVISSVDDGNDVTLTPPDKEFNLPGDTYSASWQLQAPTVEVDQTRSVLCQLFYSYYSEASTNIQIVGKEEWDNRGGAGAFTTYSTSSEAPVVLRIVPIPAIRISLPEETETRKVPMDLTLKNTGSGMIEDQKVLNFNMTVFEGSKKMVFENGTVSINEFADDTEEETGIECSSVDEETGDIRLFGIKQERSIRCYLTLPYNQDAGYSGYIVETSFEYDYSVHSKPLSIQVRPLR